MRWNPLHGKPPLRKHLRVDRQHPDNGLLRAWFLFNEGAGGNVYSITDASVVAQITTGTIGWGTGLLGSQLMGNGSTYYTVSSCPESMNLLSPYTIMIHLTPTGLHDYGNVFKADVSFTGYLGIITFGNGDWHWQSNEVDDIAAGAGSLVDNVPAAICMTCDGVAGVDNGSGTVTLYQDGVYKASAVRTGENNTLGLNFHFLCDPDWGRYFTGGLSLFQTWNRCLTPQEVARISLQPFGSAGYPRLVSDSRKAAMMPVTGAQSGWWPFFLRYLSEN